MSFFSQIALVIFTIYAWGFWDCITAGKFEGAGLIAVMAIGTGIIFAALYAKGPRHNLP